MNRYIAISLVVALFILLSPIAGLTDFYKWTDKDGNIHLEDDLLLVPEEYRDTVKAIKSLPAGEKTKSTPRPYTLPTQRPEKKEELYGGHNLRWWQGAFSTKRREISGIERSLSIRKNYAQVFEKGRRLGQSYSESEVAMYYRYKKDIPILEESSGILKEELEKLRLKATRHGVPKDIRY